MWIPIFPEVHCDCYFTCTLYFAQAPASETINNGEMLGTPTECHTFLTFDNFGQNTLLS